VSAYYNEFDPAAAAWLRELSAGGHIAPGEVDTRSIADVDADDLRGFVQCHFFAGVGGWSYALRLAGWPDDRPVWTGSCPCQPFSAAGRRGGTADERHLWPVWFPLIRECAPAIVFGEQVASKDGLGWLDGVCADLEGSGYAVGAADLCAAGVGAPHIRQRLWFGAVRLAEAASGRHQPRSGDAGIRGSDAGPDAPSVQRGTLRPTGGVDHPTGARHVGQIGGAEGDPRDEARLRLPGVGRPTGGLADRDQPGLEGRPGVPSGAVERAARPGGVAIAEPFASATDGFWRDADWLFCRDGKWRPVEPGTFPLADGVPARVGRLRGYGNAIVPQVAAEFIQAFDAAAREETKRVCISAGGVGAWAFSGCNNS
jgi:DNA (cytosine-5)-methyltransferase 1